MKVTTQNLIRAAGLSAVVAGVIFAAILPIRPPEVLASVNTSSFVLITSLMTVMSIFGLFGITGALRQAGGKERLAGSGRLSPANHLLCSPDVLFIYRTHHPAAVDECGTGVCGERFGDEKWDRGFDEPRRPCNGIGRSRRCCIYSASCCLALLPSAPAYCRAGQLPCWPYRVLWRVSCLGCFLTSSIR
jgi:hypothetical protein